MMFLVATAASAAMFYVSTGLGEIWALGWIAPVPVLLYAFARARPRAAFLCALLAHALGALNLLEAYGHALPAATLVVATLGPALAFAGGVNFAGAALRRAGPLAATLFFAGWSAALDFLMAQGPDGAAPSPAYVQIEAPVLVQTASLFGLWSVTFLLAFVAAGLASAVARKTPAAAIAAAILFGAAVGYGWWRIETAPDAGAVRTVLLADDSRGEAPFSDAEADARSAIDAYAATTSAIRGADYVLWPERIALLAPAWRNEALSSVDAAAAASGATVVAGFEDRGATRRNRAFVVKAGAAPRAYDKRRLVPGLERGFRPGDDRLAAAPGVGLVICTDMDFPAMIRADARAGALRLMLVPSWDFDRDARAHQRMAAMRGVENGFAVARAARQGLLTVNDAYGRTFGEARSDRSGMVTLTAAAPFGPGPTLYTSIGDVFPAIAGAMAALTALAAFLRRKIVQL